MINLSGEPSLSTLVLTRDGDIKYTYVLPAGMSFPPDTTATMVLSDLAGNEYELSPHTGYLNANSTALTWDIESENVNHVPSGANFEVFVAFGGANYKVRYGRVVRKEVTSPLNPDGSLPAGDYVYVDDMQRSMPGPRWINKHGRVSMHDRGGSANPRWAMASRNAVDIFGAGLLFENAAALWYAPLESDEIELNVELIDRAEGTFIAVFASDYSMTSFLGVRFSAQILNENETVQVVYGTKWNEIDVIGSNATTQIPDNGGVYRITYSAQSDQVKVYPPGSGTALLTTTISTEVPSGPGFRYCGAIWYGTFLSTGPRLSSWEISDVV